jgi:hypothetical protein
MAIDLHCAGDGVHGRSDPLDRSHMIVLAIVATVAAIICSIMVIWANGMASSPQPFRGGGLLIAAWVGVAVMWLAWWFG